MTFLILFVSTLGLISVTYYFAVEKVNTRSQALKISTAKQDFLSLDQDLMSVVSQPGSARTFEAADSGGKLNIQPSNSSLEISVDDNSSSVQGSAAYNPSGYSLVGSSGYVSGSITDLNSSDSVYMNFRSYAGTSTNSFYPSDFVLLGSTKGVSGSLADLQNDDGLSMTFRSYVSATSATSKTDAFIAYRSNTESGLNFPKNRLWDGDTGAWGGESEMATAGSDVRWVRTAVCPISERALEKIVVTLSDDGYLDAYVFDGTAWSVTENIASIWTVAPASPVRPYDIIYETSSGKALLVYDVDIADSTKDLGYKIWDGTGWSTEYYINFTGVASTNPVLSFIVLACNPDAVSNQIAMAFNDDTNGDAFAGIWDGSAWTKMTTLTTAHTVDTKEAIAIEYSTFYHKVLAMAGNGANSMAWKTYTQGDVDWVAQTSFDPDSDTGNDVCFGTLKRDPAATSADDYIMYVGVNDLTDLNAFAFDMANSPPTRVNTVNEVDDSIDSNAARCVDFAWEPTGNKGLIVWGTTAAQIHHNTYSISTGWGASWTTYDSMGTAIHPWVQLRTNPRSISGDTMILGAVMEGGTAYRIGAIKWDGTTFTVIGTNTISYDTTVITYECFELEFQQFGDPTEFTSQIEFAGASDTESWLQLVWMIDSSSTTANADAIFQLYNYQTAEYPTSGDGYLTGAVGESNVTMSQSITANPTYFRDGSGNWKMNIRIVKATSQQFDWNCDIVRFASTQANEYTCEVEFSGTIDTQSFAQVDWTADLSFTTSDVTTTLQLYDYAESQYPASGDGYITDTIGQTKATETQTITATPTNFRDAAGNWTMKIKGTKATDTSFDMQLDWVEFKIFTDSSISTIIFNGTIGQIAYELQGAESADTGLFLKGDSRTITNQSGSYMTQLFIRNGAEHPEILLRYRPTIACTTAGTESGRTVNNVRIYIINLNSSDPVSSYGKIPLKISCVSTQITTTTYTISHRPPVLLVTSVLDGTSGQVAIPISSTDSGAIINLDVVQCNIKVERSVL